MDAGKATFIVRYYGHLMTAQERLAYWHLVRTAKAMHGRSDWAAQTEARNKLSHLPSHFPRRLSDDPEVLKLTREGLEVFAARTAQRIWALAGPIGVLRAHYRLPRSTLAMHWRCSGRDARLSI